MGALGVTILGKVIDRWILVDEEFGCRLEDSLASTTGGELATVFPLNGGVLHAKMLLKGGGGPCCAGVGFTSFV
jgi:hypothetical protein